MPKIKLSDLRRWYETSQAYWQHWQHPADCDYRPLLDALSAARDEMGEIFKDEASHVYVSSSCADAVDAAARMQCGFWNLAAIFMALGFEVTDD